MKHKIMCSCGKLAIQCNEASKALQIIADIANDQQQNKEDSWLCICGKYHKGFPYRCPNTDNPKKAEVESKKQ